MEASAALRGAGSTLVCVHAHPDDEALFSGGIHALCARRGVRQVLITCTDGRLGFDPWGRTPLDPLHDDGATVTTRAAELRRSVEILGIDRLVQLGYPDSGMRGWPTNDEPDAFVNRPLGEIADRIAAVLEEERPRVVVTYGEDGFYGHPDHVQVHLAVMAAVERCAFVERVYVVAMTQDSIDRAMALAGAASAALPEWLGAGLVHPVPDEAVDEVADCREVAALKQRAVAAHASQVDNASLVEMPPEVFAEVFGIERYVDVLDRRGDLGEGDDPLAELGRRGS